MGWTFDFMGFLQIFPALNKVQFFTAHCPKGLPEDITTHPPAKAGKKAFTFKLKFSKKGIVSQKSKFTHYILPSSGYKPLNLNLSSAEYKINFFEET